MDLMEYLKQSFLFLFGEPNLENLHFPYLIFLISTSLIGFLCILLDFAYYNVTNGKSMFQLAYTNRKNIIIMFLLWGIGAGIIGFLAQRLGLIACTIQSSIIIGIGWPIFFPKLYSYAIIDRNEFEPEENADDNSDENDEV